MLSGRQINGSLNCFVNFFDVFNFRSDVGPNPVNDFAVLDRHPLDLGTKIWVGFGAGTVWVGVFLKYVRIEILLMQVYRRNSSLAPLVWKKG